MSLAHRAIPRLAWLALAALAWAAVYALVVPRNVGAVAGFWSPIRIASYLSFALAPAITFTPVARRLRIPLYDLEAIAGWSTLCFSLTFIDPGNRPPLAALLVLLVSLTVSLATIFTLVSYVVGLRLVARRSQRYDFVRARRDGYVGAMFVVGLLLLAMLGALSTINAALFGLIVLLLELVLLVRARN
jgi:hypothetical protein